jgi:hypothetical protein
MTGSSPFCSGVAVASFLVLWTNWHWYRRDMFALTLGRQNWCTLDSATGKIELCNTFAVTYYNSEKDMIRIDMSENTVHGKVLRLLAHGAWFELASQ